MKSFWDKVLFVSVLSFVTAAALLSVFKTPIQQLFGLDPYAYERVSYNWLNKSRTEKLSMPDDTTRQITLIDICEGKDSRKYIANVIEQVMAYSPSVVGIDIRFDYPHGDEEDEYLESVISRYSDRIIFACEYDTEQNKYRYSYFGTPEDGLTYAAVGTFDILMTGRYLSAKAKQTYPEVSSFPYMLALKSGCMYDASKPDRYINFRSRAFPFVTTPPAEALEGFFDSNGNHDYLPGRIVIIGGTKELYDVRNLPFFVEGSLRVPGLKQNAYQTYSFIARDGLLKKIPCVWNLLLSFLLVAICASCYCGVDKIIERFRQQKRYRRQYFWILGKAGIIIVLEFAAAALAVGLGIGTLNILPDCIYFMLAILFFDPFSNLKNALVANKQNK